MPRVLVATLAASFAACGGAEVPDTGRAPGEPFAGITHDDSLRFAAGKALFQHEFTPEEGLGPLFNERGCVNCHDLPVSGGSGVEDVSKASRFEGGRCDDLAAVGGPVFQHHVTPLLKAAHIRSENPPAQALVASIPPPALFGLGLLEAVSDADILAHADSADANHDGIAGRAGRTADGHVGRFGKKAEFATLRDFVEDAARNEIGLTSPRHPEEERPNGRPLPLGVDPAPDPELSDAKLDTLAAYVRLLAPPAREPMTAARRDTVQHGEDLFARIGCASCHVPTLGSGVRAAHAYTDLLLHDLGAEDASICSPHAGPSTWRTAPLLGMRFRQRFMHDGRAPTPDGAIRLHGAEAERARQAYERLSSAERVAVVRFIHSR